MFAETEPPRLRSKILGVNALYSLSYGDNIYVQLIEMPDKHTFVATTDEPVPLMIDKDTLTQQGLFEWNDNLSCTLGITHPKKLIDGSHISYCAHIGLETTITVYKIHPSKPKTRVAIGSFNTKHLAYGHSMGLTEEYAIILEQPIMFDMFGMVSGKPMMEDMLLLKDETTKVHVIKLSDGTHH